MAAAQVDNRPSNSRADDTPSNTATQQSSSSQIADGPNAPAQNKDRRRRGRGPQNDGAAPAVTRSDQPSGRGRGGQRGGGRGRQQQSNNNNGGESSNQNNGGNSRGNGGRSRGGRGRGRDQANTGSSAPAAGSGSGQPQAQSEADIPAVSARKRNFGGRITTGDDAISSNTTAHGKGKAVAHAAPPPPPQIREYADLRSRLVAELGSGQHECSICYSTLTTRQPCWSCDQCYTVLHLNCTKKWASTSVEQANAQLAMQEDPEMRARREQITAKCYCGLEEKDLVCGSEGTAQRCPRDESTYVPTLAFPGQDVPMWKGKAGESDILRRRYSDVWEQVRKSAALRPSGHRFQMSSWRMPTM
ncbi:FKBP12-associated protein [Tilletia horrida]|nr:FKBP12-associated protein [Tilletia horrida]